MCRRILVLYLSMGQLDPRHFIQVLTYSRLPFPPLPASVPSRFLSFVRDPPTYFFILPVADASIPTRASPLLFSLYSVFIFPHDCYFRLTDVCTNFQDAMCTSPGGQAWRLLSEPSVAFFDCLDPDPPSPLLYPFFISPTPNCVRRLHFFPCLAIAPLNIIVLFNSPAGLCKSYLLFLCASCSLSSVPLP